jgi:hypothetical protein
VGNQIVEGVLVEPEGDDPDLNNAFYAFIDQLDAESNAGGTIAVFEVPCDSQGNPKPKTAHKTKLFTVPIGAVTFDDLCDRVLNDYMRAGDMMMIQLMGTRDGRKGIAFNRMIRLKKPFNAPASNGGAQNDLASVLKIVNENASRDRAQMMAMLERIADTRSAGPNPMEFGLAMAERLAKIAGELRGPASQPSAIVPGVAAGSPMDQMMQMMTMIGMMKKFFGKGGDDAPAPTGNDFAEVLKQVKEIAVPMLQAYTANKRDEARRLPAPPSTPMEPIPNHTGAPPSAEPIPNAKEENKMKLLGQLKEGMPHLIEIAEKNGDVNETAKLVLSIMPDDPALNDALYSLVADDDCVKQLALLDARVNDHAEWFEKFRVALRGEFDPDGARP